MAGFYDARHTGESQAVHLSAEQTDWANTIESDLEREMGRSTPLQKVLHEAGRGQAESSPKPLRQALSQVRENLDRRAREWRGSARIVEQTLRQLVAAEQQRNEALRGLADVQSEVERAGRHLSAVLASFDENDASKEIDSYFAQSELAIEALDRAATELSITEHWCRSAWKSYADALDREQALRAQIQSDGHAA
jgi:hypothetical protein